MNKYRNLKIGDRVRLTEDITGMYMPFPKGHIFTIFGSSYRGWDLVDMVRRLSEDICPG